MSKVYIIKSRIAVVEEKFDITKGRKVKATEPGMPDETELTRVSLGWFIQIEGMLFAIGLGSERPDFKEGDLVTIAIKKEEVHDGN